MPLSGLGYDPDDLATAMARLRRQAADEGIEFAPRSPESLLANTHRALAASAIVQEADPGLFEAFHHALFHASFGELQNIGDPSVLHRIAAALGLDAPRLDAALAAGDGEASLREATEDDTPAEDHRRPGVRLRRQGAHCRRLPVRGAPAGSGAGRSSRLTLPPGADLTDWRSSGSRQTRRAMIAITMAIMEDAT